MQSLNSEFRMLCTLADTNSTKDKEKLLKKYLIFSDFRKVLAYALDSRNVFKVKKFPEFSNRRYYEKAGDIFDILNAFDVQDGVTTADKERLYAAASIDSETYEVVKRICNGDLKCGVGATLANKVEPGFIFTMPYCRCSTHKKLDKIKYPAIVQEKADGVFCNVLINKNEIKFLSRSGKEFKQLGVLRKEIQGSNPNINLQGELRIRDPKTGKLLDRKTGNGIISSSQYGTADQTMMDNTVLCVWNCIDGTQFWEGKGKHKYREILVLLQAWIYGLCSPHITFIKSNEVASYDEAWEFYLNIRKEGGEGAILKNYSFVWKDHTSTDQIKLKNVEEADLIICGWYHGTEGTKYEKYMGGVQCKSVDGLLEVNIGTGFSDKERMLDWDNLIGAVMSVEFESVIKSKTDKLHSLYLPRFKELRFDRTVNNADTLEDLIER